MTSDLHPCFQVVLVGSSINERDQMLFISTDEGSSFQRQPVSFTPDTLMFHPKDEDKLLAYCREGQVGNKLLEYWGWGVINVWKTHALIHTPTAAPVA